MKMNKDESNIFQMGGDMIAGLDWQSEGRWQSFHWLWLSWKWSSGNLIASACRIAECNFSWQCRAAAIEWLMIRFQI